MVLEPWPESKANMAGDLLPALGVSILRLLRNLQDQIPHMHLKNDMSVHLSVDTCIHTYAYR